MSIGILVDILYNVVMGRKKQLTKNKVGRPSLYSNEVVAKLTKAFQDGATIEQACGVAKIDHTTYHRWVNDNSNFAIEMQNAKAYPYLIAKKLVIDSIVKDKDINNAKWLLEKTEFKQVQQNNTQVNIGTPKSLLDGLIDWDNKDVSINNNSQENSEITEKN